MVRRAEHKLVVSLRLPEAVQEACARWVTVCWNLTQRDPSLHSQTVPGQIAQDWAGRHLDRGPPASVRDLLAPYRRHTIWTNQG